MTATPVEFHLPIGLPLELDVHDAEVGPGGVRIRARAGADAWSYVEGGYLFHLDEAETDDGRPPMLEDGEPVEVVLRLDDQVAASLPMSSRRPDTLVGWLSTAPDDSPLLDTESWFLAEASQGDVSYRTTFADAPSVLRGDAWIMPVLEPRESDDTPREPSALMALALSFLDSMELSYDWFDDNVVRVPVAGENGTYNVFVHAREEHRQITIHATWVEEVPVDRRAAVMELVTRINIELAVSWFELDLDHGSVSARSGLDFEGIAPTDDTLVENAFYAAERTLDRFLPAIIAVALEGLDVADIPDDPND